jgi:two-component system response regulator WspF
VKVGIVHKLGAVCAQLERALERQQHSVLWMAHDAAGATRELAAQHVDVLLWSVEVPGSSAQARRGGTQLVAMYARDQELAAVDEALAAGAATALHIGSPERREELAARLETVRRLIGRGTASSARQGVPLVAIGASTGGPQALAQVCAALPSTFAGSLVVVQHIDTEFMPELATTLASRTGLQVALAVEGGMPQRGSLHIAARPDLHLVLDAQRRFRYVREPATAIHRPSVDVLFESLARHWPGRGTAVLLTGMGRDGARGMGLLQRGGWRTIAQDASSSAVYGMPRAAVEEGAANEVLSLADIGPALLGPARA